MKKFWEADPHLLKDGEAISLPGLGADVARHSSQFWRRALRLQPGLIGRVTAFGPVINKFTFQDCIAITLPDASEAVRRREKLSDDCRHKLRSRLKQVTNNPSRQHPEVEASVKLMTPNAEAQIREGLSRQKPSRGETETEIKTFLREVYAPMLDQVIASITPGSPLRRFATRNHAQVLLNAMIDELVDQPARQSNAGTPPITRGKQERGRKKGSN